MKRCDHCVWWVPSVLKGETESGYAIWWGDCTNGNQQGRGHHSLYTACSRFTGRDEHASASRWPLVGPRVRDGCEWDPLTGTGALEGDHHHGSARADLIVGAGGRWRLCRSCAELPEFARFRKRKPIRGRPLPTAEPTPTVPPHLRVPGEVVRG